MLPYIWFILRFCYATFACLATLDKCLQTQGCDRGVWLRLRELGVVCRRSGLESVFEHKLVASACYVFTCWRVFSVDHELSPNERVYVALRAVYNVSIMSSWSNDDTMSFLEAYQSKPCIWNPKDVNHKDKKKVADAWYRLSQALKKPVKELKAKKEILMTTFRKQFKKKQDSIRSGADTEDLYQPCWFAYQFMESFLMPVYTCNYNLNTETNSLPLRQYEGIGEQKQKETETPNETGSNTETNDKNIKIPVQRRRAVNPPDLENAEKEMSNAFNTLNQIMLNKNQKTEDDCELYGRLLANKLRKYSETERQEIMYEIDGLLLRRRRNYSPQCVSSNDLSDGSYCQMQNQSQNIKAEAYLAPVNYEQ